MKDNIVKFQKQIPVAITESVAYEKALSAVDDLTDEEKEDLIDYLWAIGYGTRIDPD